MIVAAPKPSRLLSARWPLIVVGILLTHTTLMILAVVLFVRHQGSDVIPDYYDKAVHWDQIKAARLHDGEAHDAASHQADQDVMP